MRTFRLFSEYKPKGDQPQAIDSLVKGIIEKERYTKGTASSRDRFQTLLGVTGSGKTYTLANVIERIKKPTLVISHNKTLAAQLYTEFKEFFPENAVEYFVSYYDYYQPEAYIPQADMYIEKDASINEDIDRLRLRATSSLMSREDVLIVASVSCIYGLGSPEDYKELLLVLGAGDTMRREDLLERLVGIHYDRNDVEFERGKFRVRGDMIEIFPAYLEKAYRIELDFGRIKSVKEIDPLHVAFLVIHGTAKIVDFVHVTDVVASDPYPIGGSNLPIQVSAETIQLRKLTGDKKPAWMVTQAFGYQGAREPTPQEEYCMNYLAVVGGAKGIIYFMYKPTYIPLWEAMGKLNNELKELESILLSPDVKEEVQITDESSPLQMLQKKHNGKTYLITVNTVNNPVEAEFYLPGLKDRANKVRVLFENRSLRYRNGGFKDNFKGYERHVYEIEG